MHSLKDLQRFVSDELAQLPAVDISRECHKRAVLAVEGEVRVIQGCLNLGHYITFLLRRFDVKLLGVVDRAGKAVGRCTEVDEGLVCEKNGELSHRERA